MLIIVTAIVCLGLLLCALAIRSIRLTPFVFTLVFVFPVAIGHAEIDSADQTVQATVLFLASLVCLVLGYAVANRATVVVAPVDDPSGSGNRLARNMVVGLAIALTALHFAIGGAPLLRGDIEVARFDFTSSGFAGIPGRAYLYGLPIAAGIAVWVALRSSGQQRRSDFRLAGGTLLILAASRILGGFKGGLLEFVTIAYFAATSTVNGIHLRGAIKWLVPAAFVAFAFAYGIAPLYATSARRDISPAELLLFRVTTEAATPGHLLLSGRAALLALPSNSTANDLSFYAQKYLHWQVGSADYSFDQIVAASVYHEPLSAVAERPSPVTFGAAGQLLYDFGLLGGLIGMFVIGVLYRLCEALAARATGAGHFAVALAGLLLLQDYVHKGGLIYLAVNWAAVLFGVGCIVVAAKLLRQPAALPVHASALKLVGSEREHSPFTYL